MTSAPTDIQPPQTAPAIKDDEFRPEPPLWRSILKTARPKQWPKNALVLAAPAAAGMLTDAGVLGRSIFAVFAFTLASVGTYFINDVMDHKADALHPRKKLAPDRRRLDRYHMAVVIGTIFLTASLLASALVLNLRFTGLIAGYVVLTLSYSLRLKHVAIFDLACVAGGFILRMIAGGVGTDVYISEWFLAVGSFCALFVVTGKRYAEVRDMGEGNTASRAVLAGYNVNFLRSAWTMALTVSVASYFQWTFNTAEIARTPIWYQLSAVPWVLALLRYTLRLETGHGGAPEEVLSSDRVLQGLGLVWILFYGIGVYAN